MPGISFRLSLDGSEQVNKQLQTVAQTAEQSFGSTTAAISKLGKTTEQAFATAAAAAKTFGASAGELDKVNRQIQVLADQGQKSGVAFSKMARNFDAARGALGGAGVAFAGAAAGAKAAGTGAAEAAQGFSLTRRQVGALRTAFRELNLGAIGGEFAVLARVGMALGPVAGVITGIGGAIAATAAAMVSFANKASETEKALSSLQKVSGVSFENLSKLQQVFARGGTPVKTFVTDFTRLTEQVADARQQAAIERYGQGLAKWANDIDRVTSKMSNLSLGLRETFSPLTLLDTKARAVFEVLAKIKDPQEQWLKLADIMKNIGSDMDRMALGKKLGLSNEEIATLSKGSAIIKQQMAEVAAAGQQLTADQQRNLRAYADSVNTLSTSWQALKDQLGATSAPVLAPAIDVINESVKRLTGSLQENPWGTWGRIAVAVINPIGFAIQELAQKTIPQMKPALDTSSSSWATWGRIALAAINPIGFAVQQLWNKLNQLTPQQRIADAFNALSTAVNNVSPVPIQQLGVAIKGIPPLAWEAAAALNSLGREAAIWNRGAFGQGIEAQMWQKTRGFASGGFIGGRGTGTSDSNLAWVSRGEHIMPARAVRQPGVLALLEALRRSGGNLRGILDDMGHFARGGLVLPAFANGGPVGGMSNVTIQFPGLPPISGLRASSSVVDELHKAAALAQVRSGGRKPSRYS